MADEDLIMTPEFIGEKRRAAIENDLGHLDRLGPFEGKGRFGGVIGSIDAPGPTGVILGTGRFEKASANQ